MILWYPRLQDAFPSKSGLPHRWPTAGADTPINSCEGRPDTAKIKSGFTLHLKLGARLLYILQLPTFLPLLSFLWPPTSFPSNFSFLILYTSKTTHSPYPLLSTYLVLCASKTVTQVNCHWKQNLFPLYFTVKQGVVVFVFTWSWLILTFFKG